MGMAAIGDDVVSAAGSAFIDGIAEIGGAAENGLLDLIEAEVSDFGPAVRSLHLVEADDEIIVVLKNELHTVFVSDMKTAVKGIGSSRKSVIRQPGINHAHGNHLRIYCSRKTTVKREKVSHLKNELTEWT